MESESSSGGHRSKHHHHRHHHHHHHKHNGGLEALPPPECAVDRGERDRRCLDATGAPPARRVRFACEHVDDSEERHNQPYAGGLRRSECTSFNATCGDDSEVLLHYCLPEVYDDRTEVEAEVLRERAAAVDTRHNMGNRSLHRTDGLFFEQCRCDGSCHRPRPDAPVEHKTFSGDATVHRLAVDASADPFDSWPGLKSEYPVMVRRPDDPGAFYASVASSSESE